MPSTRHYLYLNHLLLFRPGGAACQLVLFEHPTTHRPMITRCFSVDNKDFETQDEIEALDSSVHSLLFRSRFQLAGLASCLLAVCVFLVLYWRRKKTFRDHPSMPAIVIEQDLLSMPAPRLQPSLPPQVS